jgi:hypothetical protein
MNTANPSGFAFARFERPFRDRRSGPWVERLYQLGLICELRLLSVQGAAAGYFPRDDVARWLRSTDSDVQRTIDRARGQASLDRLPAFMKADDLLEMVNAYTPSFAGSFQTTLMLRDYIDDRDTVDFFYMSLLFSSDEIWTNSISRCQASIESYDPDTGQLDIVSAGLVDGAYLAAVICSDVLANVTGKQMTSYSPWHNLDRTGVQPDIHVLYYLLENRERAVTVAREAINAIETAESRKETNPRQVVREIFIAKLLAWATGPQYRNVDYSILSTLPMANELYALVPSAEESLLSSQLAPELPWACLLWRLAPTDERSLRRYNECIDLVYALLSKLGVHLQA